MIIIDMPLHTLSTLPEAKDPAQLAADFIELASAPEDDGGKKIGISNYDAASTPVPNLFDDELSLSLCADETYVRESECK
jgi:hypothetical protein